MMEQLRSHTRWIAARLALAVLLLLLTGSIRGLAAVPESPSAGFIVHDTGDAGDVNAGDGLCETAPGNGVCTLRAAIEETNALVGADTIDLSISLVIPDTALPALNDATGGTTVKGSPTWVLGSSTGAFAHGFHLVSDNNQLQGLLITSFSGSGVFVQGNDNVIGTDGDGVDDDTEGNFITSSGRSGVEIRDDAAGNWVAGNFIGLSLDGQRAVPNDMNGVGVYFGAHSNLIGTNGDGTSDLLERNVISGNGQFGVEISGAGADQNTVAGNYIGTDSSGDAAVPNTFSGVMISSESANNLVGTDGDGVSDELERNVISGNGNISGSGVRLSQSAANNVIAGNYIGVSAAGDTAVANAHYGILIQSASTDNLIGTDADGTSDGLERNVISGNGVHGVYIFDEGAAGNVVAGNYVGTDAAGSAALPNGGEGVRIHGCADNRVGGTKAAERNVLSANTYSGVSLYGGATDNLVQGNYIGTDAAGEGDLGNGWHGADVLNDAIDNQVGGTAAGAGNLIAFNTRAGIRVHEFSAERHSYGNSLRCNAILQNIQLGIDLSPEEGVTPNDPGDADSGANNLQNFPQITSAVAAGGHILINGTLNSAGNTTFELDFYASSSCDASGHGEGEIYLGACSVVTEGNGDANFAAPLSAVVPQGYYATATATDPSGNTSEFSACLLVTQGYAIHLPLVLKP